MFIFLVVGVYMRMYCIEENAEFTRLVIYPLEIGKGNGARLDVTQH